MIKPAITQIQTGLATLGYYPGKIDGLWGKVTRTAAEQWIRAGGVPTPGVAGAPAPIAQIYQGSAGHPVHEIVVHCTATRPEWMEGKPIYDKRTEIKRWHLANGWSDIGYHWLIDRDGKMAAGRAETAIGAHVAGHNAGTIGVSLIGGFGAAATDRFADHFTSAQATSLRQLIQSIGMRTQITRVSGHNEHAAKACPGFSVPLWLKGTA